MKIALKNVKIARHMSQETTAFTASLWIDNKRVGDVRNEGCGGPNDVWIEDRELRELFHAHVTTMPDMVTDYGTFPMNVDLFISDLLEKHEHQQWIKRQTRRKIIFRLDGDKANEFRTVSKSDQAREFIRGKYGSKIVEMHG